MPESTASRLCQRYLKLLGVQVGPPTLDLLRRLEARHLERIPFETISKLYYLKRFGLEFCKDG